MKGLVLKDLFNLKQQWKQYLLIIGVWLVLAIGNGDASFFAGVMMIFILLIPMSAISYDEKAKWERYALTLPVTRKQLVLSKYVLTLICAVFSTVISLAVGLIMSGNIMETLISQGVVLCVGILLASIFLPILFKYGVEKSRVIFMISFILPTAFTLVANKLNLPMPSEEWLNTGMMAIPFITVAAAALSVMASIGIYRKKAF